MSSSRSDNNLLNQLTKLKSLFKSNSTDINNLSNNEFNNEEKEYQKEFDNEFNNLNKNKKDSKHFYDKYVKFNKNRKEKINKSIIKLIKILYK